MDLPENHEVLHLHAKFIIGACQIEKQHFSKGALSAKTFPQRVQIEGNQS